MNEQISTGYIPSEYKPENPVFGAANELGGAILNPSGDWTAWLPNLDEQQNIGVEPDDCVSEATLRAIEILANQQFGDTRHWSARYLAWVSGTQAKGGNDPQTVLNALKQHGTVLESDWPNTSALTTLNDFYATPPQAIQEKALEFTVEYAVDGEAVAGDVISMGQALQYSPLTVAGYAWVQDSQGMYETPPGAQPCHDFVIYKQDVNIDNDALDSYENDLKKLEWNYQFSDVMRFSLVKNVGNTPAEQAGWKQFLYYFTEWINQTFGFADYSAERLGGVPRSPLWPGVRAAHLKLQPNCAICGGNKKITVHHRLPFHIDKSLELNPQNLITLCEGAGNGNHHLIYGHWGNYATKWNPSIDVDTAKWLPRFTAKIENENL